MEDFLDSDGIVDDGDALASRLRQDGYLCIKNLLPREDVLRVRGKFLAAAAAAGWLEADTDVGEAIADPAKACVDPEAPFVGVLRQFCRNEAGHALKLHPNIIGLFERIFGEPVLAHPLLIPRCIFRSGPSSPRPRTRISRTFRARRRP